MVVCIGLNVTEVAHDIQQQVSCLFTSDLSLVNSYDTWHGTYTYTCIARAYVLCITVHVHVYARARYKECLEANAEDYPGQSARQRCDLV